ncbi:hypothetical protein QUF58_09645 [Anaerolineales bacterium HSG24]|nr:hypothetical protein [Anaerolineales bacterium HSG24]
MINNLEAVRYVTNQHGERTEVLVPLQIWEKLLVLKNKAQFLNFAETISFILPDDYEFNRDELYER